MNPREAADLMRRAVKPIRDWADNRSKIFGESRVADLRVLAAELEAAARDLEHAEEADQQAQTEEISDLPGEVGIRFLRR